MLHCGSYHVAQVRRLRRFCEMEGMRDAHAKRAMTVEYLSHGTRASTHVSVGTFPHQIAPLVDPITPPASPLSTRCSTRRWEYVQTNSPSDSLLLVLHR